MKGTKHTVEQIIAKLRQAEVTLSRGLAPGWNTRIVRSGCRAVRPAKLYWRT